MASYCGAVLVVLANWRATASPNERRESVFGTVRSLSNIEILSLRTLRRMLKLLAQLPKAQKPEVPETKLHSIITNPHRLTEMQVTYGQSTGSPSTTGRFLILLASICSSLDTPVGVRNSVSRERLLVCLVKTRGPSNYCKEHSI